MGIIRRKPQFDVDEAEAFTYLDERNPQAATKFLIELQRIYEFLADFPKAGVRRLPERPQARIFPYQKYVILYSVIGDDEGIVLARLFGPLEDWQPKAVKDLPEE